MFTGSALHRSYLKSGLCSERSCANLNNLQTTIRCRVTLSSLYTHFKTLKEKSFVKTLWKKVKITQNEQFHLFPLCFLCNLYLKILLIANLQLSSAASLNLGWSQNLVLGSDLNGKIGF